MSAMSKGRLSARTGGRARPEEEFVGLAVGVEPAYLLVWLPEAGDACRWSVVDLPHRWDGSGLIAT
jgi:hypothetical protein